MQNKTDKTVHPGPWRLRLGAGILVLAWLSLNALRCPSPAEAWLITASVAIAGHLLIGVYVFIYKLRAVTAWHQRADTFAFLFLFAAAASTGNTPLWCASFAGLFAIAILKYQTCAEETHPPALDRYIRSKIRLESPAVFCFMSAALVTAALPETHPLQTGIPVLLFSGAALFAVYLILIRRIYRNL